MDRKTYSLAYGTRVKSKTLFLLNSWEITQCPIFYDTAPRFPCQGKSRGKKQAARRCLLGGSAFCHGFPVGQFWGGGVWLPLPWPPLRRWPRRCQRERLFFSPPSPGLEEGASRLGFSCRAPLGLLRPRLRLLRRREGAAPSPSRWAGAPVSGPEQPANTRTARAAARSARFPFASATEIRRTNNSSTVRKYSE